MSKVYIAAPYGLRHDLLENARRLSSLGHEITSRWLNEPSSNDYFVQYLHARRDGLIPPDPTSDSKLSTIALHDYQDLQRADVFLRFGPTAEHQSVGQGRFVETGMAFALGLEVVLVGPRESIFDYLPLVQVYETFEAAVHGYFVKPIKAAA